MPGPRYSPLIGGYKVNNVTITGGGKIDGQGEVWWEWHKSHELNYTRGRLVELQFCSYLTIDNITLQNSPFWTLHPIYCQYVTLTRITIFNPILSPNTDGIDLDSSSHVVVSDCSIECGDDNIVIKSGYLDAGIKFDMPSSNITIQNNFFGHGSGIAIGSETAGGVHDIRVFNNTCEATVNVVRLKTSLGSGGVVQNVVFDNNTATGVVNAVWINMNYEGSACNRSECIPTLKDVHVYNLQGYALKAGSIVCLASSPCTGLDFANIDIWSAEGFDCSNAFGSAKNVYPSSCLNQTIVH